MIWGTALPHEQCYMVTECNSIDVAQGQAGWLAPDQQIQAKEEINYEGSLDF